MPAGSTAAPRFARILAAGGALLVALAVANLLAPPRGGGAAAAHLAMAGSARRAATATPTPTATLTPLPTATLRLFVGPRGGSLAFLRGINEARVRLLVAAGSLADPGLEDALVRAHARGVDVRVLYDPTTADPTMLGRLGAAGVLLRAASPAFSALSEAAAVVDHRYVLLSTAMLTSFALDGTRSFVVRDRDPLAIAQVAALFYDDWLRRPPSLFVAHLVVGPDQQGPAVAHLIDLATGSLDVATRRIDDPAVAAALVQAHRRGVSVRLLTSADAGWGADIPLVIAGLPVRRLAALPLRGTVIVEDGQRVYLTSLALTVADASTRSVGVLLRASAIVRALRQTFTFDWRGATVVHKPPPPPPRRPLPCRATRKHPCPTPTATPTAAPTETPVPKAAPSPHRTKAALHTTHTTGKGANHRRTITVPLYPGVRLRPTLTLSDPVAPGGVQELVIAAPAGSRVAITVAYPGGTTRSAGTAGGRGVTGRDGLFVDQWTIPRTTRQGQATLSIVVRHGTGWRSFSAAFTIK